MLSNAHANPIMTTTAEFTLIYDSHCPICRREVAWLQSRNAAGCIAFQDIHADGFVPERLGVTEAELMAEIHGVRADGSLVKGIDAFYATYLLVGLGWLAAPLRWRLTRPLFARLYAVFARYRLPLGALLARKRCQTDCRV